jgi:bile acid:Na+ symporter, BASS family
MSTVTELIKIGILASVFLTVLGMGLAATWNDATYLVRRPALLARSLFSMFVLMPVICVSAALLFHLPPAIRVALVALAISPVPPLLPQKEFAAGGHGAYAISLVAIAAVLSVFYVPLITSLFAEWFNHPAEVSSGVVARIVLTTILVPLALGMAIRAWMPSLAGRAAKPLGLIGVTLVLLCCLPLLIRLWPFIASFFGNGTLLMLGLITLIGTGVGHFLGGPDSRDRTVLGLSTSARHPAVAIAVTNSAVEEGRLALAAVVLYVLVVTVVTVPYVLWSKKAARTSSLTV